jgi:hypothetical protein
MQCMLQCQSGVLLPLYYWEFGEAAVRGYLMGSNETHFGERSKTRDSVSNSGDEGSGI